jgi:hypothetical protein
MNFAVRRSYKYGPIRVNVSQSGLGVSAGAKGARIHEGALEVFIRLERRVPPEEEGEDERPDRNQSPVFGAGDVGKPVDTSREALISQINDRVGLPKFSLWVAFAVTLLAVMVLLVMSPLLGNIYTFSPRLHALITFVYAVIIVTFWLAGVWVAWVTNRQEKYSRAIRLTYEWDQDAIARFNLLCEALDELSTAEKVWYEVSKNPTFDWRQFAGAKSLITRKPVKLIRSKPPHIQIEQTPYGLKLDKLQLYFLPDKIYLYRKGKYDLIRYQDLSLKYMLTKFVEYGGVPGDASIIDSTWRYIKEDGEPDMSVRKNVRVPMAEYGRVIIAAEPGLKLTLLVSNPTLAHGFTESTMAYAGFLGGLPSSAGSDREPEGPWFYRRQDNRFVVDENFDQTDDQWQNLGPYQVLGVTRQASLDEIETAYQKKAQQYQPENLENLTPEYSLMAEESLIGIKEAYQEIIAERMAESEMREADEG